MLDHTNTTDTNRLTQNTISNLSNTYNSTVSATVVVGLSYSGFLGVHSVMNNSIHSLSAGNEGALLIGLNSLIGDVTIANNFITLSPSVACNVRGILDAHTTSTNLKLYFNTVYLGGTINSTATSAAWWSNNNTANRNVRNNIFYNARSNTGTGKNYAIYLNYSTIGTLTLDYNNYFANGTNGVLGFFNSADVATLADWKTAIGQDANSLNSNPVFAGTGTVATDYKPAAILIGATGTGITADFGNATRAALPTMGAWETTVSITMTNFTPTSGGVDTQVTITGTGFSNLPLTGAVRIGGVNVRSYTIVSNTEIRAFTNDGFSTDLVEVANVTSAALGTPNFTRVNCSQSLIHQISTA